MKKSHMGDIWERLENFLQQNAPGIYEGLAPGATEGELTEVERSCGFLFPPDVRQSYLRHNGQLLSGFDPLGGTFIPCCFGLLSISEVLSEQEEQTRLLQIVDLDVAADLVIDTRVKPVFLDAAWVPFAGDMGGNRICLDFDPAPGGSIGQIVAFDHSAAGQRCLAPDFKTWLNQIVSDLEAGRLIWDEEIRGYHSPEDGLEGV